jgi:hypothetical protein
MNAPEQTAGELRAAIARLRAVAAEGSVDAGYGDFPFPGHTLAGDLRAVFAHPSPSDPVLEEASAALEPFAQLWDTATEWDLQRADNEHAWGFNRTDLLWGQFRRAHAVRTLLTRKLDQGNVG